MLLKNALKIKQKVKKLPFLCVSYLLLKFQHHLFLFRFLDREAATLLNNWRVNEIHTWLIHA